jgi:O-antigen ligase
LVKVDFLLFPTNTLELLCIAAIIISVLKNKKRFIHTILSLPKIVLISSLLIISGTIISTLSNDIHLNSLGIVKSWFLIPILFAFSLFLIIRTKDDIEKIFISIYSSTIIVAIISIIYKISHIVTYDNRLSSFYLSPNYLAMYLTSGIFVGLYFLLKNSKDKQKKLYVFFHVFFLIIIGIPFYYTYSYGSWLSLFITTIIVLFTLFDYKKYYLQITCLLFFVITCIILSQIHSEKFLNLSHNYSQSSLSSRKMIWRSAFFLIQEKPILGIGPGNFQEAYLSIQDKYPPYLEWAVPQPHNIFLAFWLQSGILGLIGFVMLLFYVFSTLLFFTKKQKKGVAIATTLFCLFLYTMLHGIIDTTYWKNDLSLLFWIEISILLSIHSLRKTSDC